MWSNLKNEWSSKNKNTHLKRYGVDLCELSTGYDDATYKVPTGPLVKFLV
jgi:hypothetical protein